MKITTADAEAAARRALEIYDRTRFTGGEYRKFVEDFTYRVKMNPDMTDQEKRDVLWVFEHRR